MSQTTITLAFEQWKAQQGTTGEPVLLDEFVFANVPALDPDQPVDRNETLPPAEQIVHRQAVSRKGVVNDNAVDSLMCRHLTRISRLTAMKPCHRLNRLFTGRPSAVRAW
ncbi:phage tail protein [Salmonella enterica]|uniref:phage tail-collar fiber domain-containing protein n=1 Tax=Salmonella enterica TaxID=28901 RepID=UPI003737074E